MISSVGCSTVTWHAPDGTQVPLTRCGLGWHLLQGVSGFGAPATEITAEPLAAGGEQLLHQYTAARRITLPIHIAGADHAAYVAALDLLAEAFGQTDTLGPGRLVVARPDGRRREIAAHLEGDVDDTTYGTGYVSATTIITLWCPDPWWSAVDAIEIRRETATGHRFLGVVGGRRYPALSSGRTLGDTTATNPGTVPAYPVWTVHGPADTLTATSARLGGARFVLAFPVPLAPGEFATITTDPLNLAVTGPAGEDWTSHLDWPGAELWPLMPGTNALSFVVVGGGSGTAVVLRFKPRYRSA